MIILKLLSKFIKVLRSAASPNQIAWGFALGAIMGLTPLWSLHNLIILILIIILKINFTSAIFSLLLFSLFAYLLDPLFHNFGYQALAGISALEPTWTSMYNAPIAPFTKFNNTVVMGSFLFSLLFMLPNYFLFKVFVVRYRESWNDKIKKWKISKALMGNKVVQLYFKIRDFGG